MDRKPRILIFSLAYDPFWGGAELAVKEITDRLGGEFDFDMVTYRFSKKHLKQERVGGVNIFRVGLSLPVKDGAHYGHKFKKLLWGCRAFFKARSLHRKQKYDMTWCLMANYAAAAAFWFKLFHGRIPLLLTLQEGDEESYIRKRVGIFLPFWKLFFKMVNHIQVISTYLGDWARKNGAKCQIDVVPNGVSLRKFQISSRLQNSNYKTIITTSRLVKKNGIDILIKAVAELENIKVLIVGNGPEEQDLKNLVKKLEVEDRVEFIGSVPYEDIPKYLAVSDIFVRVSRSEGLGSSFLEAMAAGLPVIGTDVGGIPDFLKDQETGLFVKVDDSSDLAQKIKMLIENDKLRNRLIENGKKLVEQKYDWNIISQQMSKVFNSII